MVVYILTFIFLDSRRENEKDSGPTDIKHYPNDSVLNFFVHAILIY
jgi:hypothetical protein